MKKTLISESEKARILGMHYNAMGKTFVSEQVPPTQPVSTTQQTQPSSGSTEPTFTTPESVWADPRFKTVQNYVWPTSKEAQQGITREQKYNSRIMDNLVDYYLNGGTLIGKEALGWKSFDWRAGGELLLQDVICRFPIVEIYKGFNHGFQNTMFEPSTDPCIYITSQKMQVSGPYGNKGTLYISSDDFDAEDKTKNYKQLGVPNGPHIRIIGTVAYYYPTKDTNNSPKRIITTPLVNQKILNLMSGV
jgi:hypothetical protein